MNAQEIYDKIVNHLRQQGTKAIAEGGYCCYRTPLGLKCAVGCLIEDDEYSTSFEKKSFFMLMENSYFPTTFVARFKDHSALIVHMQRIHDGMGPVSDWERQFSQAANIYNLVYTPPQDK